MIDTNATLPKALFEKLVEQLKGISNAKVDVSSIIKDIEDLVASICSAPALSLFQDDKELYETFCSSVKTLSECCENSESLRRSMLVLSSWLLFDEPIHKSRSGAQINQVVESICSSNGKLSFEVVLHAAKNGDLSVFRDEMLQLAVKVHDIDDNHARVIDLLQHTPNLPILLALFIFPPFPVRCSGPVNFLQFLGDGLDSFRDATAVSSMVGATVTYSDGTHLVIGQSDQRLYREGHHYAEVLIDSIIRDEHLFSHLLDQCQWNEIKATNDLNYPSYMPKESYYLNNDRHVIDLFNKLWRQAITHSMTLALQYFKCIVIPLVLWKLKPVSIIMDILNEIFLIAPTSGHDDDMSIEFMTVTVDVLDIHYQIIIAKSLLQKLLLLLSEDINSRLLSIQIKRMITAFTVYDFKKSNDIIQMAFDILCKLDVHHSLLDEVILHSYIDVCYELDVTKLFDYFLRHCIDLSSSNSTYMSYIEIKVTNDQVIDLWLDTIKKNPKGVDKSLKVIDYLIKQNTHILSSRCALSYKLLLELLQKVPKSVIHYLNEKDMDGKSYSYDLLQILCTQLTECKSLDRNSSKLNLSLIIFILMDIDIPDTLFTSSIQVIVHSFIDLLLSCDFSVNELVSILKLAVKYDSIHHESEDVYSDSTVIRLFTICVNSPSIPAILTNTCIHAIQAAATFWSTLSSNELQHVLIEKCLPMSLNLLVHSDSTIQLNSVQLIAVMLNLSSDDSKRLFDQFDFDTKTIESITNNTMEINDSHEKIDFFINEDDITLDQVSYGIINKNKVVLDSTQFISVSKWLKKMKSNYDPKKRIRDELLSTKSITTDHDNLDSTNSFDSFATECTHFIFTPTSRQNVLTVLDAVNQSELIPLLIEGDTGVGKSATVTIAAQYMNTTLIRMNMSSRITIEDLLGTVKISIDPHTGGDTFKFNPQPFTIAFEKGYWMLLDELNLAAESVLQVIETALDTGILTVKDPTSIQNQFVTIKKGAGFRLFATQNPSTGLFRGKREKLSTSLISRFTPLIFHELPNNELIYILEKKLQISSIKPHMIHDTAIKLIDMHGRFKQILSNNKEPFPEVGSHTEITIRELLKLISRLCLIDSSTFDHVEDSIYGHIAFEAWCIYGSRFRTQPARLKIKSLIDSLWTPAVHTINESNKITSYTYSWSIYPTVRIDNIELTTLPTVLDEEYYAQYIKEKLESLNLVPSVSLCIQMATTHTSILKLVYSNSFILSYGLYIPDNLWLDLWVHTALEYSFNFNIDDFEIKYLAILGAALYCGKIHTFEGKNQMFQVFATQFSIDENLYQITINETRLKESLKVYEDKPFILTNQVISIWKQLLSCIHSRCPVLLVGSTGCGKSEVIRTFCRLLRRQLNQMLITPETEPSSLVGYLVPNDSKDGPKLKWADGIITQAIRPDSNTWVLLDSLTDSDPCVLERLNPVLEDPPVWVLSENGETINIAEHTTCCFFATMTPPVAGSGALDLSPALANRFTIIYMEDICQPTNTTLTSDVNYITKVLLSDCDNTLDVSKALCFLIQQAMKNKYDIFNLQMVIRLLNCAHALRENEYPLILEYQDSHYKHNLAYTLCQSLLMNIAYALKDIQGETSPKSSTLRQLLLSFLTVLLPAYNRDDINILLSDFYATNRYASYKVSSSNYLLVETHKSFVDAIMAGIYCRFPLLLEGPAASGKTAMITHLGSLHYNITNITTAVVSDEVRNKFTLKRVNMTEGTTLAHLFGSYIPGGTGLVFQQGILYESIEKGYWFLADEFNLADPSVLSVIAPLLENKSPFYIPNTNLSVIIHPEFRFFATQNPSTYANRNKLPPSLRSRFMEIRFHDFTKDDIYNILSSRCDIPLPGVTIRLKNIEDTACDKIAQFYQLLNTDNVSNIHRMTLRETTKWTRRIQMLKCRIEDAGISLLGSQVIPSSFKQSSIVKCINEVFSKDDNGGRLKLHTFFDCPFVEETEMGVTFGFYQEKSDTPIIKVTVPGASLRNSSLFTLALSSTKIVRQPPKSFLCALVSLTIATQAREPVLLVGPTSFKSLLLSTWADIMNKRGIKSVHLTPETESSDLIGQIQPCSFAVCLKEIPLLATQFIQRCHSLQSGDKSTITILEETIKKVSVMIKEWIKQSQIEFEQKKTISQPYLHDNVDDDIVHIDELDLKKHLLKHEVVDTISMDILQENDPLIWTNNDDDDDGNWDMDMDMDMDDDNPFKDLGISAYSNNENIELKSAEVTPKTTSDTVKEYGNKLDVSSYHFVSVSKHDGVSNDTKTATSDTDNVHCRKMISTIYHQLSDSLIQEIKSISDVISSILVSSSSSLSSDTALCGIQYKLQQLCHNVLLPQSKNKTLFLYKDGLVIQSLKKACPIILEDINLPSQAVVERLNSLLEPTPSFDLSEDSSIATQSSIDVLPGFQVFATVNISKENQRINLSAATRSRFTEIYIPEYTDLELKSLLCSVIENKMPTKTNGSIANVPGIFSNLLLILKQYLMDPSHDTISPTKVSLTTLLRVIDFTCDDSLGIMEKISDYILRTFIGARFFILDKYSSSPTTGKLIFSEWIKVYNDNTLFSTILQQSIMSIWDDPTVMKTSSDWMNYFTYDDTHKTLTLLYASVTAKLQDGYKYNMIDSYQKSDLMEVLRGCTPTESFVKNIARVFAALSARSPLLLEGPPGVGKTEVVRKVCDLLGVPWERINFSSSINQGQLFGAIVPRFDGENRIFEWQPGSLTRALMNKKWILLDEINLAPAEVLESLVPLLYRNCHTFHIPGTEDVINVENIRIFATMNPSNIGGGRSKLPRSIKNKFTIVELDVYTNTELYRILLSSRFFGSLLPQETGSEYDYCLTYEQLSSLFRFQNAIMKHISDGRIGREGGPYEFNLRDYSKLRDVLANNFKDLAQHMSLSDSGIESDAFESLDINNRDNLSFIRELAIRKFAELVYVLRFTHSDDQQKVKDLLDIYFPIQSARKQFQSGENNELISIGTGTIRIRSVYLRMGEYNESTSLPLIHSEETIKQLELLAAATQGGRAVLVQGVTASGKTSLVKELARICNRKLETIILNVDTEVADLIGQWQPIPPLSDIHKTLNYLSTQIDLIHRMMIIEFSKSYDSHETKKSYYQRLAQLLDRSNRHSSLMIHDIDRLHLEVIHSGKLLQFLDDIKSHITDRRSSILLYRTYKKFYAIYDEAYNLLSKYEPIDDVSSSNNATITAAAAATTISTSAISFVFKESFLVKAIREGHWVLLDNINSANQDTVERINSLLEEDRELTLFEGPTLEKLDIHPDFRIFATANFSRKDSNKMSTALLNRMIRLQLPSLDHGLDCISENEIMSHHLYTIISTKMNQIHGGADFVVILLLFHRHILIGIKSKSIEFREGFEPSFRTIDRTIRMFRGLLEDMKTPHIMLKGFIHCLFQNYISCITSKTQKVQAITHLQSIIDKSDFKLKKFTYLSISNDDNTSTFESLRRTIHTQMSSIEWNTLSLLLIYIYQFCVNEDHRSYEDTNTVIKICDQLSTDILVHINPPSTQKSTVISTLIQNLSKVSTMSSLPMLRDSILDYLQSLSIIQKGQTTLMKKCITTVQSAFQETIRKLLHSIQSLFEHVTFHNAFNTVTLLEKIVTVIEKLNPFFLRVQYISTMLPISSSNVLKTSILQVIDSFEQLLSYKRGLKHLKLISQENTSGIITQFINVLDARGDRSLAHQFKSVLNMDLIKVQSILKRFVTHLERTIDDQDLNAVYNIAVAVSWFSVIWTCTLKILPSLQAFYRPKHMNDDTLLSKLSVWEASIRLSDILPSMKTLLEPLSNILHKWEHYDHTKLILPGHPDAKRELEICKKNCVTRRNRLQNSKDIKHKDELKQLKVEYDTIENQLNQLKCDLISYQEMERIQYTNSFISDLNKVKVDLSQMIIADNMNMIQYHMFGFSILTLIQLSESLEHLRHSQGVDVHTTENMSIKLNMHDVVSNLYQSSYKHHLYELSIGHMTIDYVLILLILVYLKLPSESSVRDTSISFQFYDLQDLNTSIYLKELIHITTHVKTTICFLISSIDLTCPIATLIFTPNQLKPYLLVPIHGYDHTTLCVQKLASLMDSNCYSHENHEFTTNFYELHTCYIATSTDPIEYCSIMWSTIVNIMASSTNVYQNISNESLGNTVNSFVSTFNSLRVTTKNSVTWKDFKLYHDLLKDYQTLSTCFQTLRSIFMIDFYQITDKKSIHSLMTNLKSNVKSISSSILINPTAVTTSIQQQIPSIYITQQHFFTTSKSMIHIIDPSSNIFTRIPLILSTIQQVYEKKTSLTSLTFMIFQQLHQFTYYVEDIILKLTTSNHPYIQNKWNHTDDYIHILQYDIINPITSLFTIERISNLDPNIEINFKIQEDYFKKVQDGINKVLHYLSLSEDIRKFLNLDNLFKDITPILLKIQLLHSCDGTDSKLTNDSIIEMSPQEIEREQLLFGAQQMIDNMIQEAESLRPKPFDLLHHLRRFVGYFKHAIEEKYELFDIKVSIADMLKLRKVLDEYKMSLEPPDRIGEKVKHLSILFAPFIKSSTHHNTKLRQ